jgi:hypothetical protein
MYISRLPPLAPAWLSLEVFVLAVYLAGIMLAVGAYTLSSLKRLPGRTGTAAGRALNIGALLIAVALMIGGIAVVADFALLFVATGFARPQSAVVMILGGAMLSAYGFRAVRRWRQMK